MLAIGFFVECLIEFLTSLVEALPAITEAWGNRRTARLAEMKLEVSLDESEMKEAVKIYVERRLGQKIKVVDMDVDGAVIEYELCPSTVAVDYRDR